MTAKCTTFTHQWTSGPGVDPMSGLRNVCGNCGAIRFEEARVYDMEQVAEAEIGALREALRAVLRCRVVGCLCCNPEACDGCPPCPRCRAFAVLGEKPVDP